ncbi:MAG: hypothetical protein KTR20_07460 [Cellvibrionaceae bacterium]|nr:hypothetical protein [Cellvibrionaceae bacterium]
MLTYAQWEAEVAKTTVSGEAKTPIFRQLFTVFFKCSPAAAAEAHQKNYEQISVKLAATTLQHNFPKALRPLGFDINSAEFLRYSLTLLDRINLVNDDEPAQYGLRKGQWMNLMSKIRKALTLWVKDWLHTHNVFYLLATAEGNTNKYYEYLACETLLIIIQQLSPKQAQPYSFYYASLLDYLRYRNAVKLGSDDRLQGLTEPRLFLAQSSRLSIAEARQLSKLLADIQQQPSLLAYTELAGFSKALHLVMGKKEDVISADAASRTRFLHSLSQSIDALHGTGEDDKHPHPPADKPALAARLGDALSDFNQAAEDPARVGQLGCATQGLIPKDGRSGCRSYMWGKKTFLEPIERLLRKNHSSPRAYHIARGLLLDPLSPLETNQKRRVRYGLNQQQTHAIYALMKAEPKRYPILGAIVAEVDTPLFRPLNTLVARLLDTMKTTLASQTQGQSQ